MSDKIELTEEQFEEIICSDCPHRKKDENCGCGCFEYDRIRHYSLEKGYIKQNPVERAEETINHYKQWSHLEELYIKSVDFNAIVHGFFELKNRVKQLEDNK
jgi:hypothetical protein